jgi:hypothetical protein
MRELPPNKMTPPTSKKPHRTSHAPPARIRSSSSVSFTTYPSSSRGSEAPAFGELPRQHPSGEQVAQGSEVGKHRALYERLLVEPPEGPRPGFGFRPEQLEEAVTGFSDVVRDLGLLLVSVAAHQVLNDLAVGFHASLLSYGSLKRCAAFSPYPRSRHGA